MGKYSLESYEKYKTHKLRPKLLTMKPINVGCDTYKIVTASWKSLEPSKAKYDMEILKSKIHTSTLLVIDESPPDWAKDNKAYLAAFIRKLGSELDGNPNLIGVLIDNRDKSEMILQDYLDGFSKTYLIARLEDSFQILKLQKVGAKFGLLVTAKENNRLDCCELFARYNLQHTWESAPVLIHFTADANCQSFKEDIRRWHVCAANKSMGLGYNFALRRLTYPRQISSLGAMPLRFWFVNTGTSPCYDQLKLKVKLSIEKQQWIIDLAIKGSHWMLGDIVENKIAVLPDLKPGNYTVSIGLFSKNQPILLDIDASLQDGFYQVGQVDVDTQNRDELFHIWDTYYPEGYYPLEDPKAPESDED